MLKKLHPAQILPVGVFDPSANNILITEVVGVLQIVKGDHQPRADSWSTIVWAVRITEHLLHALPIDDVCQLDQRMIGIDDARELRAKQISLFTLVGVLFLVSSLKFAGNWWGMG